MPAIRHPQTGFAVGDPYSDPFEKVPVRADVDAFASSLILSASGWRGVFGRDDEDPGELLSPAKAYAAACMADVFADFALGLRERPRVAVGIDTRPTGPAIADVMIRVFLARGLEPRYAFITAAPEIMAWAKRSGALPEDDENRVDCFCYVSASHNPKGHNGVKFGLTDGGVLPADVAKGLSAKARAAIGDPSMAARVIALCRSADTELLGRAFASTQKWKRRAISDYTLFTHEVTANTPDRGEQERALSRLETSARGYGLGVVAEMNGSARCLSIDEDFLSGLGIAVRTVNAVPRAFAHRIVPEGLSLDDARAELEKAHAEDPRFVFGYVPDCDGDRGNIVYHDDDTGRARELPAQEVFALAALSELAGIERDKAAGRVPRESPVAVAVNDATSMRVEEIARAFGARVERAETGEANVVSLARRLRAGGCVVRVLGEGSNGGNITHPAAVRDPLNTVVALAKLLLVRDGPDGPGLYRSWLDRTGRSGDYREEYSLSDIVASLPPYVTTSVFEDRAALRIGSSDHAALKRAYQGCFERSWPDIAAGPGKRLGFTSWEAASTLGSSETRGITDFASSGTGGLSIRLLDDAGEARAFLWMRGSGTESAFRILVDIRGGGENDERELLDLHRALVLEADALV